MAVLKFRAWHKEAKAMREVAALSWAEWHGDWFAHTFEVNTLINDKNQMERCTPDELVLMQSTGLKDKDGQEIFEGDILRTDAGACHVEAFGVHDFRGGSYVGFVSGPDVHTSVRVIGNVYENPQLRPPA